MKHRRMQGDDARLEMTPMIDIVFQLLIFFIVTTKQEDILGKFTAAPPGVQRETGDPDLTTVRIDVTHDGFRMAGQPVSRQELVSRLTRIAAVDGRTPVLLACDRDSAHGRLVQALDVCAEAGLDRLAVMSR